MKMMKFECPSCGEDETVNDNTINIIHRTISDIAHRNLSFAAIISNNEEKIREQLKNGDGRLSNAMLKCESCDKSYSVKDWVDNHL